MGFLKKFFQVPSLAILEVMPKPQPKPSPIAIPLETKGLYKPNLLKPDERILAIETLALSLGWTWDQLWKESKRRDLRGLVSIIQKDQTITAITPQYIQLEKTSHTGKPEIQRFYNHNTHQPWLRRGSI